MIEYKKNKRSKEIVIANILKGKVKNRVYF